MAQKHQNFEVGPPARKDFFLATFENALFFTFFHFFSKFSLFFNSTFSQIFDFFKKMTKVRQKLPDFLTLFHDPSSYFLTTFENLSESRSIDDFFGGSSIERPWQDAHGSRGNTFITFRRRDEEGR